MLSTTALVIAATICLATNAASQQAILCDWVARADAIAEPWEENTRTFANGKVRLALMDVGEPAAGGVHILILSPPYSGQGDRQCKTLGMSDSVGFSDADFSSLEAGYDPAVGLIFDIDVRYYDGTDFRAGSLRFTLNQATGAVGGYLR